MRDEELDRRLAVADRMADVDVAPRVLDELVERTRDGGRRSRRARLAVVAGGLALALGGGIAAAPAVADTVREWLAIAEWQPDAGGEVLPDSEMIDLSAPDLDEYIASIYPEWLPLAPGRTREQLIAAVIEQWSSVPEPGFTQEVGFRHSFEILVYCDWVGVWLAGDPGLVVEANRVLADAPQWPAFVATDGDIIVEIMTEVARSAADGDREGVLFVAGMYGCEAADGEPHGEWFAERAEYFESLRAQG